MISVRAAADRGRTQIEWLDSRHSFSFGDYHDPAHMGFRSLRVINEDKVQAGQGFGMHGHRNMEILTLVLSGGLAHSDSLGNGSILKAGDFQRMSAGKGIRHSEFNPSSTTPAHFLQIWLEPNEVNMEPSYQEIHPENAGTSEGLKLIAHPQGAEDSLAIHQDAVVYFGELAAGATAHHEMKAGRGAWVQVIDGVLTLNDRTLNVGDGATVENETVLDMRAKTEARFLLFDLA